MRLAWAAVLAIGVGGVGAAETHILPFFPAAPAATEVAVGAQSPQGLLRVHNHGADAGQVRIVGFDDSGRRAGPVVLELAAGGVTYLDAADLQAGNPDKGLAAGLGAPADGDWWLTLASELDVEVGAYARGADGFLTSAHDSAPESGGLHRIAFFNPGSNTRQHSQLRLVNSSDAPVDATIRGVDDLGRAAGPVRTTVPARAASTFTARDLEAGAEPLAGALGDGAGKWRLTVAASGRLHAMSLLANPTGHIANLSTAPSAAGPEPGVHHVPLFPAASRSNQGFLRVANSGTAGSVRIVAFDETGTARAPITLAIGAGRTTHFNSTDLERGNEAKGLSGGVGDGAGDWRLEMRAEPATDDAVGGSPQLQVLAYVRSPDGFIASMHDVAPVAGVAHRVPTFHPGDDSLPQSVLRVVNLGAAPAAVVVSGLNDGGVTEERRVVFGVPAEGARTVSAQELERGGDGFAGALGAGRMRLAVTANQPIVAMSLLRRPAGALTNLSTTTRKTASEVFRTNVAGPVVQKCSTCHVSGGTAGATRLVFLADGGDAASRSESNRRVLERFVQDATDGAQLVLEKAAGEREHGGGRRLETASADYANLALFLRRLAQERKPNPPPTQPAPLLDAIPNPGGDIDPATGHIDIVHTAAPQDAYAYADACTTGVAVRRALPGAADQEQREVVDHKLECDLAPLSSYRVRADGVDREDPGVGASLAFTTASQADGPAITVRAARTVARDTVNDMLDGYIEEALIADIESSWAQLVVAVLIDALAKRTWAELRDPDARYDVVAQSVSYASRNPSGSPSSAVTGLVAMPDISAESDFSRKNRVVVLSHATGATPSDLDDGDAWFALASMFAGRGYLTIAPDNWGRGELRPPGQPETYLMGNRSANNSVDLLKVVLASDAYQPFHDAATERTDVSLIGYSQGAHTALALWLALHTGEHGVTVRELFAGAGPHNLLRTFRGAMQHFAGECDGNEWCRHVDNDVVLPYVAGRILPGLLAYTDIGLTSADLLESGNLRADFVTGYLAGDAEYETLKAILALNSFTNLVAPGNAIRHGTEINLYHSEYDRLVPQANTRELATLLAQGFDVVHHDDECGSGAYETVFELVDRPGVLHLICGMEVLDDVLKRFP